MSQDKLTTLAEQDGSAARVPTMRDVAALAGVSIKTVSRVVNQEPGVSPELAERVLDAVGLLGYRHNLAASSLRRADHKSATIGVLLEDLSNPFSAALHRAIEAVARPRGPLVLAGSSDEDPDRQQELLHALVSRRVDGLIAMPASGNQLALLRERRLGRPMVLVDRPAPEADSVVVDNRAGLGRAVHHLVAHGHRRIGFLGAIRTLQQLGLQQRVALLGFDDFPLADLLSPAVSVVAQDPTNLGQAAAELLFARVDGDRGPPRRVMVPTRLVPRGSGEIAPS